MTNDPISQAMALLVKAKELQTQADECKKRARGHRSGLGLRVDGRTAQGAA